MQILNVKFKIELIEKHAGQRHVFLKLNLTKIVGYDSVCIERRVKQSELAGGRADMKLSTKGRYGLRAIIDLALNSENGNAVCIQSISERQNISESYLEQLVRKLRTEGLVKSVRGAGGGYELARPAEKISVGDVLRALEGSIEAVSCGDDEGCCDQADLCVTRLVWDRVNKAIEGAVDTVTIAQLVEESRKKQCMGKVDTKSCAN